MKSSLETEIEDCTWAIDNILENTLDTYNFIEKGYIDKTVAHHLEKNGYGQWVYNDEFSGPQINEISEKALIGIENNKIVYHQKFQIISEIVKGTRYFKAIRIKHKSEEVKYKDISADNEIVIGIQPDDIELLKYQN